MRTGQLERKTTETTVKVEIELDGKGSYQVETGVPFLNHMLAQFAKHGLFDLSVEAKGDLAVNDHHTVEDVGICLGRAIKEAVGREWQIARYGAAIVPMMECLILVAMDLGGRRHLSFDVDFQAERIGTFETDLVREFFDTLVSNADLTLHIRSLQGGNAHHSAEAIFKGFGQALSQASTIERRVQGVPSTKGTIG